MIFKIINGKAVRYDSAGGITKIDDLSVDFSQAESRENISPTDSMKTILGKIMKWFSDLSAGAASSLLGQNLTEGKVLVSDDGGKVAASVVDANKVGFLSGVTEDIQSQINSLNSAILKYVDYTVGDVTVSELYYKQISVPGERSYLFASVITWGTCSGVFTVVGSGRNFYALANNGVTVGKLKIRLWYI